ncbi:MAG: type III-B CRISPR module-associated protein Cmr5 [Leptospiraceae bacterium]|nr:type III-B CRISPR module-associated protein Cmr5 [Leptospiraceae bacterium]
MSNKRLDLDRQRAEFAFKKAQDYKSDKFTSNVRKFPMLIKNNGLCAAVAFAYSKGINVKDPEKSKDKKAWKDLYNTISEWLKEEPQKFLNSFFNNASEDTLMKLIAGSKDDKNEKTFNFEQYRFATVETLALFSWLRRFVGEEEENSKNEDKSDE